MIRHNFTDRLFHRFALRSPSFRRFCFQRECERNGHSFDPGRKNLFLAAVARSGSTALLNCLYESDAFASTCYRHMPFVMAPSLSKLVDALSPGRVKASERRHGDGIRVDLDSPEALDGVFWSTCLERKDNRISPCDPGAELLDRYAMFIENLLLHEAKDRYLSKMNQRIEHLPDLVRYFEGSLFLLPFRDPLHQSASLLRQHRRFACLSSYEAEYLHWLDHREFGAIHLEFFESSQQAASLCALDSLDYWLEQWHRTYSYLSQLVDLNPRLIPLCYEDLAASSDTWSKLSKCLGIEVCGDRFDNRNDAGIDTGMRFNASLMEKCQALYARLSEQARAHLC